MREMSNNIFVKRLSFFDSISVVQSTLLSIILFRLLRGSSRVITLSYEYIVKQYNVPSWTRGAIKIIRFMSGISCANFLIALSIFSVSLVFISKSSKKLILFCFAINLLLIIFWVFLLTFMKVTYMAGLFMGADTRLFIKWLNEQPELMN